MAHARKWRVERAVNQIAVARIQNTRMVYRHEALNLTCNEVGTNLCVDPSTVSKTVQLFRRTGHVSIAFVSKIYSDDLHSVRDDHHQTSFVAMAHIHKPIVHVAIPPPICVLYHA